MPSACNQEGSPNNPQRVKPSATAMVTKMVFKMMEQMSRSNVMVGDVLVVGRTLKLMQPLGRGRGRWERPRGECGRDSSAPARRRRDGTGAGARRVDRRRTAPWDCLERLVLAGFQPVALIGWRARAFNSCRESLEEHSRILLLGFLVANREIVGADSDHSIAPVGTVEPRRSVATASSASCASVKTAVGWVTSRCHWSVPDPFRQAVSYGQNVQAETRAGRARRFRTTEDFDAPPVVTSVLFCLVLLTASFLRRVCSRIQTKYLERSYPNSAAMDARASLTS